jgi:hypothetical protein
MAKHLHVSNPQLCYCRDKRLRFQGIQTTVSYVRFEVFTAVTMKKVVFWDIKTQSVPHRRHITYQLQSSAS